MQGYGHLCRAICTAAICGLLLCSCSGSGDSSQAESTLKDADIPEGIVGSWDCRSEPAETDELYSGYLHLDVNSDGSFSMFDIEAGNPSLRGNMELTADDKLLLNTSDDEDFSPPAGWESMSKEQEVDYKISSDVLELSYTDDDGRITWIFDREEE